MEYYEKNMPCETPVNAAYMGYFGQDCPVPLLRFPEEYDGQRHVRLACTQHGVTSWQQRRITDRWAAFLRENRLALDTVMFCTKLTQAVFDALCCQESLTALWIKWCAVADLSPLGQLENLEVLRLGNTEKVTDYSPLGRLNRLKTLEIESNDKLNNRVLHMQSDSFLRNLPRLELLNLCDVRVRERDFLFEENVKHIPSVRFRQ